MPSQPAVITHFRSKVCLNNRLPPPFWLLPLPVASPLTG
ncbi:hypothetical protein O53_4685 [Microcystis aeruginosa TAIHU98]|uniref:Uncharacterized protein n=1 Tax=Microcystis aeruginosa TAIHU98 TaxID=1134457 RepID=L7E254_MICAE|nr:hypothetical protein O53_4685 [Microcystis aeruginosa TAIHU98]ODV37168.1 hypothetical protein BFG60_3341 [Microcystis aeruginosa NIES-98]